MADTFLNTTGMASNNVQANLNQTNAQNITNTENIGNNPQNNLQTINPITIPIQIQPQIAGQNQIQPRYSTKHTTKSKFTDRK